MLKSLEEYIRFLFYVIFRFKASARESLECETRSGSTLSCSTSNLDPNAEGIFLINILDICSYVPIYEKKFSVIKKWPNGYRKQLRV